MCMGYPRNFSLTPITPAVEAHRLAIAQSLAPQMPRPTMPNIVASKGIVLRGLISAVRPVHWQTALDFYSAATATFLHHPARRFLAALLLGSLIQRLKPD